MDLFDIVGRYTPKPPNDEYKSNNEDVDGSGDEDDDVTPMTVEMKTMMTVTTRMAMKQHIKTWNVHLGMMKMRQMMRN